MMILPLNNYREISDQYSYVLEELYAEFDNALPLLHLEQVPFVIYGGCIRDIIAGLPIQGDLDILCYDTSRIIYRLQKNPKWVAHTTAPPFELSSNLHEGYGRKFNDLKFINEDKKVINIIENRSSSTSFEDFVKDILDNTDLICCGLIIDNISRIYEVLPGAEQNCINKILKINPKSKAINIERTKKRVEKLVQRGWTSEIDFSKIKTKKPDNKHKKESQKNYTRKLEVTLPLDLYKHTEGASFHEFINPPNKVTGVRLLGNSAIYRETLCLYIDLVGGKTIFHCLDKEESQKLLSLLQHWYPSYRWKEFEKFIKNTEKTKYQIKGIPLSKSSLEITHIIMLPPDFSKSVDLHELFWREHPLIPDTALETVYLASTVDTANADTHIPFVFLWGYGKKQTISLVDLEAPPRRWYVTVYDAPLVLTLLKNSITDYESIKSMEKHLEMGTKLGRISPTQKTSTL